MKKDGAQRLHPFLCPHTEDSFYFTQKPQKAQKG